MSDSKQRSNTPRIAARILRHEKEETDRGQLWRIVIVLILIILCLLSWRWWTTRETATVEVEHYRLALMPRHPDDSFDAGETAETIFTKTQEVQQLGPGARLRLHRIRPREQQRDKQWFFMEVMGNAVAGWVDAQKLSGHCTLVAKPGNQVDVASLKTGDAVVLTGGDKKKLTVELNADGSIR